MNVYCNTYFLFVLYRKYLYILGMNVGQRVKELRKKLKISQKEMGDLLNVAQQQISYYETSGNIDPMKLAKISETYQIDIKYFFGEDSIDNYRGVYMQTNSMTEICIPAGWDEILEDVSNLDYDKIKVIETVIKALVSEYSK